MVKANETIFHFNLAMMESFSDYLSRGYFKCILEDSKPSQTIIIKKIVQMFHTLEMLVKVAQDQASERCVLRGILDSVTTYCFVYQRTDIKDVIFRHYLYILDGWKEYKNTIIETSENCDCTKFVVCQCDDAINQIEEKLQIHPFYIQNSSTAKSIIQKANWKYESLQNPRSLKYWEIYKNVGFDEKLVNYYQGYLSQFAHGLCLSNTRNAHSEQMKSIIYESIPIEYRFIQAILHNFRDDNLMDKFLGSEKYKEFLDSKQTNLNDIADTVQALVHNDKTLLI